MRTSHQWLRRKEESWVSTWKQSKNMKSGTVSLRKWMKHKRTKCVAVHTTWLRKSVNNYSNESIKMACLLGDSGKCYRNLVQQLHGHIGTVPQRKWSKNYRKMCSSQRNNKNGLIMTEKEQSGVFNSKCWRNITGTLCDCHARKVGQFN